MAKRIERPLLFRLATGISLTCSALIVLLFPEYPEFLIPLLLANYAGATATAYLGNHWRRRNLDSKEVQTSVRRRALVTFLSIPVACFVAGMLDRFQ